MKYQSSARGLAAAIVLVGALAGNVHASVTIAQNPLGSGKLVGSGYWAQSFTTTDSGYDHITFSWLSRDGTTDLAAGSFVVCCALPVAGYTQELEQY